MLNLLPAAALGMAAVMPWSYVRQERRRCIRAFDAARGMCEAAQAAERAAARLLRLTAHELRGIGMALQGHVDCLAAPAADFLQRPRMELHEGTAGVASVAAQLQGLADELQDHAFPALAPRILREELVDVGALLTDAVAAIAASLGPGRRNWRVAEASSPTLLWADRRAAPCLCPRADRRRPQHRPRRLDRHGLVSAPRGNGAERAGRRRRICHARAVGVAVGVAWAGLRRRQPRHRPATDPGARFDAGSWRAA